MRTFLACVAALLLLESTQGERTYGMMKKSKILPKIKPDPIIKKDPILIPDKKDPIIHPGEKLPFCNVNCPLIAIPIECRQETFGFENGVRCKGCDADICTDRIRDGPGFNRGGIGEPSLFERGINRGGLGDIRGNPDLFGRGDIGRDRRQNTGGATELDRWRNGDVWQNQGVFNDRGRLGGRDRLLDGPQLLGGRDGLRNRGGFLSGDRLFDGPVQGGLDGRQSRLDRLRDSLDRNNRFSRNQW